MPPRKRTRKEAAVEQKGKEDLSQISIDELRQQLVDLGEDPGPIDTSNKSV